MGPVDCEALRAGWLHQPSNALSSLAFVIVGLMIVLLTRSRGGRVLGLAAAVVGAGSVAFHARATGPTEWLHDWSLASLAAVFALGWRSHEGPAPWKLAALIAGLGVAFATAPGIAEPVTIVLVVAGVAGELAVVRSRQRTALLAAAGAAGVGVAAAFAGRTGSAWCDPGSLAQFHAAWHALAAFALLAYAAARRWLPLAIYRVEPSG